MQGRQPDVFFASAIPERIDRSLTLPARFQRLLERMPIAERVKGKHLFEKLHARDPYSQVRTLEALGAGTGTYRVVKVK